MLPILKRELVEKKGWISEEGLIDCYAISQFTPGVIAVNAATFIGFNKKGFLGALCATLGVIFAPITVIMLIATVLRAYENNVYVKHAMQGMNVAISAVIFITVVKLIKKTWKDIPSAVIGLCIFSAVTFFGVPILLTLLCAALTGLILRFAQKERGKRKKKKEGAPK